LSKKKTSSYPSSLSRRSWRWWVPRLLSCAVGLVLLAAGLIKSTEMDLFIRQIRDYGIISDPHILMLIAWLLVLSECVLGTALILSFLPGISLPQSACLFLIFIGATLWAWATGITEDCGCFGSWVRRTPGEAMFEDLIALAALIPAWLGLKKKPARLAPLRLFVMLISFLVGIFLPLISGFSPARNHPSHQPEFGTGADLSEIQGLDPINLKKGRYLIVLMDTDCLHCRDAVEEINFLVEEKDLPPLIGLTVNNEQKRRNFIEEFGALFPLGQIKEDVFLKLLGAGEVPRVILMQDQVILEAWDRQILDTSAIKEALNRDSADR
jgi:uncharacterized membrane protein YphA (DoxX/SURF4 family)